MKTYIIIGIVLAVIAGAVWYGTFASGIKKDTAVKTDVTADPARAVQTATETTVETAKSNTSELSRIAASAKLENYDGAPAPLATFQGKPLVINSWAAWCPFCREELPDFAKLQKEFGDTITVIAIDRQEPLAKAKGYTDGLGITDLMAFLLDPSDSFYKSIGGFSMPETIFINSAGDIIVHKRGPMSLDEMREHTNKILLNNTPNTP